MIEIVVPAVGEVGMEVTFVAWLKEPGDDVIEGEPLFQLDTQKTLLDVEAVGSGRLTSIAASPGDLVEHHQVIARLLGVGEVESAVFAATALDGPDAPGAVAAATEESAAGTAVVTTAGRGGVSPRARRLAEALGIDLGGISGTGGDGLITESDVRAARVSSPAASPEPGIEAVAAARAEQTRRAVAAMTSTSWRTVPHFYVTLDADLTDGLAKTRPTTLICAAIARALREHPECNLEWSGDRPVRRSSVDLGILVDTPAGLLLPAVRGAESLDATGLTVAIAEAVDRAKRGLLRADDFGARSLSISNLGMFAVDQFDGVVAAPDTMLLGVGRARPEPRWDGTTWVPRTIAKLTLSVDHRALDGAAAARLLTTLERLLQEPSWLT